MCYGLILWAGQWTYTELVSDNWRYRCLAKNVLNWRCKTNFDMSSVDIFKCKIANRYAGAMGSEFFLMGWSYSPPVIKKNSKILPGRVDDLSFFDYSSPIFFVN